MDVMPDDEDLDAPIDPLAEWLVEQALEELMRERRDHRPQEESHDDAA